MSDNPIKDLVEEVGNPKAMYLLDVHRYTLYKWVTGRRHPSHSTLVLARLFLFLLREWNWTVDELTGVVSELKSDPGTPPNLPLA